jgi:hypothetical protein
MNYYISPPPVNPVSRVLSAVAAALALIGFFFFGLVVVGILLAVALVVGFVIWVRARWLGHSPPVKRAGNSPSGQKGEVIDAEYTVVYKRRE